MSSLTVAARDPTQREAAIVAARLRGASWPAIASEHGLSERECRRVFAAADRRRLVASDPRLKADIAGVLSELEEQSTRHRQRAAATRDPDAQLAALQTSLKATKTRARLLADAGLLPRADRDGQLIVRRGLPGLEQIRQEILARQKARDDR